MMTILFYWKHVHQIKLYTVHILDIEVQYIFDYTNLEYPNKVVPKKSRFSERFLVYPNHSTFKTKLLRNIPV